MSQLKFKEFAARRERGSALVAVAAFATLLSFAIGGFLGVARNVVNQEIGELNDDRAFLAAESGLLIGTRWLREDNNWSVYQSAGYPGHVYQGTINGCFVTVSVIVSPSTGALTIQSTAAGVNMPYAKQMSWTVRQAYWDAPGVFINDAVSSGGVGGGGINNEWFDGPVHTNGPIKISAVSGGNVCVRFINGDVTVHNNTDSVLFKDGGHWSNYGASIASGNNYDFGIWVQGVNKGQAHKVDPFFEDGSAYGRYTHSHDSFYVHKPVGQTITLPVNLSATKPAILNFYVNSGTGMAAYYYYDAAGAQFSQNFPVNAQVIRVPNDVAVLGIVKGQATVKTDSGKIIYPMGDIMYHGFQPNEAQMDAFDNSTNYGLGDLSPLNSDVLGLVSGGDIVFKLNKYRIANVAGETALEIIPGQSQNATDMFITAQLFAIEDGCGIHWESTNANDFTYKLRTLGTRAVDVYEESHNAQGDPGNFTFKWLYDTRFSHGLVAPGAPTLRADDHSTELFILNTNWFEENIL